MKKSGAAEKKRVRRSSAVVQNGTRDPNSDTPPRVCPLSLSPQPLSLMSQNGTCPNVVWFSISFFGFNRWSGDIWSYYHAGCLQFVKFCDICIMWRQESYVFDQFIVAFFLCWNTELAISFLKIVNANTFGICLCLYIVCSNGVFFSNIFF